MTELLIRIGIEFSRLFFFLDKRFHHARATKIFLGNAVEFIHQGLESPEMFAHATHGNTGDQDNDNDQEDDDPP